MPIKTNGPEIRTCEYDTSVTEPSIQKTISLIENGLSERLKIRVVRDPAKADTPTPISITLCLLLLWRVRKISVQQATKAKASAKAGV